jgi:hypothetical protein
MARNSQNNVFWRICGYDGTTKIFEELIPTGQITQRSLEELLRSLAGRALTPREIVSAYAKRNAKRSNDFLQIHREVDAVRKRTNYYCGNNPHYIANIICVDQSMEANVQIDSKHSL